MKTTALNTIIRSLLILLLSMTATNLFAYPNTNASYIMNYAAGTAGGWNTTDSSECTSCHADNGSTGSTFESLDSLMGPSWTDYFYFKITSGPSSPVKGGFNMKVVNSSGTTTGTLYEFDANAVMSGSIARHSNANDNSWYLGWTSPSTATTVRFAYCANSVSGNANGDYADVIGEDGDNIFCSYKTVTVNDPPYAVNDLFEVSENHSGSGYYYPMYQGTNDSDAESSLSSLTLTYESSSISGANLSCDTINERCTISLTSDYDYLDDGESVTLSGYRDYVLHDSSWTSSNTKRLGRRTGRMTIKVNGVNDTPTADNDSGYTINEGATSTTQISLASLLSGDVDPDDTLSVQNLSCVSNCSSVSKSSTYVVFTHDGSETTSATFTYQAYDGTAYSNTATVTVSITPVNDAPTADDDSGYTINEGATSTTQISLASILTGDNDNEGTSLTVSTLTCATNCSSVSKNSSYILFEHDGSETTSATFTYRVHDNQVYSNTATVTVTITPQNDTPTADNDSGYTINEGASSTTQISTSSILTGDNDDDGDDLTVTNLSCGTNCSGVSQNSGFIIFEHDDSETTSATFTYTANDGKVDSNTATVTLSITPQNDAPIADADSGYTINEGATSSTQISIASLLSGDSDSEGDSLTVTNLSCVSNCNSVSDNGTYILFEHDGSETTSASFTYTANDGTIDSNTATVTLAITPQNDAPIADNESGYTIDEGATSSTQISLASLLSGDTDAENDTLTVKNLSCATNCNSITENGIYVLFEHDGSEASTATFTYTANDGSSDSNTATVTITITPQNDTPIADNDSGYTLNEGATSTTEISIASLLSGDSDADGDSLSVNNLSCSSNCNSVSDNGTYILFEHDGSETTSASFTYTANDGTVDSNVATVTVTITPLNDAPLASSDSGYTINEGASSTTEISIASLLSNDSDNEGDGLTVTNLSCGSNCNSVTQNATHIVFTHDGSETTSASFTYTANDATDDSNVVSVSIIINPQNDTPSASNDSGYSINEAATTTTEIGIVSLLSNDSDNDGDSLSIENLSCVSNCSSVSENGTYVIFTHDGSETTSASFTYTVNDGSVSSNVATVTVTIVAQNDLPIANNDSGYSINEGASSTTEISIASLLSNDSDDDISDTLTVDNLSCVSNCSSVSDNGTHIIFTHDDSETTSASFSYTANDGTVDSNVATVSLTINAQNDAPTIAITANDFTEDSGHSIGEVAASYITFDSEGSALTVTFTTGTNLNSHYTLDTANKEVEITSNALVEINDGNPLDVISLTITDTGALTGNNSDTPGVFATSDAPTFNETSQSVNVDEDNSIDVTYSATDDDNDNLLIEWAVDSQPSNGSVSITGNSTGASAVFTYTPNANYNGSDAFIAKASSGGADIVISTSVTVNPVNDAPTADNDSGYSLSEGATSSTQISLASLILGDTDAENDVLTVTNISCGTNCSSISSNGTHIIFEHDGSDTASATFTYTANDGNLDSNVATVTISIIAQNDAPIADNDSGYTINEGATSSTEISVASLLSGDTDSEGDSLTVTNLNCVSNCSSISDSGLFILFEHDGSETTSASFSYTANDGNSDSNVATVSVTITPQNDAPIADNDNGYSVAEGGTTTTEISIASLLSGDTDAENDSLTVTNLVCASNCTSVSQNATHVLMQHDGSETSTATFTYTARDAAIDSNIATVSVNIIGNNDTPIADDDSGYSIDEGATSTTEISIASLLAGDSDGDGDVLSVTNLSCASNCSSVSANATHIIFTHDNSETTSASFTYTANDGTIDSNVATVTMSITPQNDAPVADDDSGYTLNEGASTSTEISLASLLTGDTDSEGDSLSITNLSCGNNCSSVSDNGTYVIFEHNGSETTSATFTYTANDGTQDSNVATVTIIITPQNDSPVADNDSGYSLNEGATSSTEISIGSILTGDTDNEGDTLTITNLSCGNNCSSVSATATHIVFEHDGSETTSATFTYTVNDGTIDSNVATVTIVIVPQNDTPVAILDTGYTIDEGAVSTTEISSASLLSNDSDADGDTLTITNLACVSNCTSVSENSGFILFEHDDSETTTATFSYTANDGTVDSNTVTVSVLITPINDAPVAVNDSGYSIDEGTTSTNQISLVSLLDNDSDAEGAVLTIGNLTCVSHCNSIQDNGIYILVEHDGSESNTATFSYTVNDGTVDSNIATVSLTINGINDAPSISEGDNININMDEDSSPTAFNLTLNATDPENDTINWQIISSASQGIATVEGTGSNKSISYTPSENHNGTDAFDVQISDSNLTDTITVNVTISPINDAPVLTQIVTQTIQEGDTLIIAAQVSDSDTSDINDGLGSLTWSISSGNDGSMTLSNTGTFGWTAPETGIFNNEIGPIELSVSDGLEDGTSVTTMSFNIVVSPIDDDSDGIANYNDFCPTIADSTNADTDGDGTAGIDTDPLDAIGGDACDTDDDNDGMPDEFEESNQLDSKDASDALDDFDGDGVSNIDEYLAGTHLLLATLTIDATGYLTGYTLVEPDPTFIHPDATSVFADNYGPYRPGQHIITWKGSNATTFNLGTGEQILNINPIVSFSTDQQTAEGANATVTASINGDAVNYPVIIEYTVSGTSDSSDHDAQASTLEIEDGSHDVSVSFDVFEDTVVEDDETIILSMGDVSNAVKGQQQVHTATIVEGNVQPSIELTLTQNGVPISTAYIENGDITVSLTIKDPNVTQSHSINWQSSSAQLSAPEATNLLSWDYTPTIPGSFEIITQVTDNGLPILSNQLSTVLVVSVSSAPVLTTEDSDGDGVDDATEGYDDSDGDGVPDYLDAIEQSHLQADQTVDDDTTFVLQTDTGLSLIIGKTARASETSGTAITDSEIEQFGSESGGVVTNSSDNYVHIGGVYDFIIDDLIPSSTAYLVIPLQVAIPKNAVYRKYSESDGWKDFIKDENNQVYSAAGNNGACPEPQSSEYEVGLQYLYTCIQLKIEDGGSNDQDGTANGRIVDPGVVSITKSKAVEEPKVEEGGEIPLWFIFVLSLFLLRNFRNNNKNV